MKRISLIVTFCVSVLSSWGHDFEVGGIYYNVTSATNKMVAVTYRGSSYEDYSDEYEGTVAIPSTVTYNGNTYKVTSIEGWAFYSCRSLKSVTIPESVTSIGEKTFGGCWHLTSITVAEGNAIYDSRNGCKAIIETSSNTLIAGCATTVIPESVTSIGHYAFVGCRNLTSITIPESVTSIGDEAFGACSSLTSITIPESVTSIGSYAFSYCSLTSITIPESVTSIGSYAFFGCRNFTSVAVAEENTVYDSRNGCNAIIETSSNTLIVGCSTTIIPEGVTSIGESAFIGYSSLTSITIPESVTSIGDRAFEGCSSLNTIHIPENSQLTSIGHSAFEDCSSLTSITIPERVTSIGEWAFEDCSSLTSITCKAVSPPSILHDTFSNVDKSIPVIVPTGSVATYKSRGAWNDFTNIVIAYGTCGDKLTWYLAEYELIIEGTGAMYDYDNDEKDVPWYEYRESIKTVTMKKGITSIGDRAFHSCSNLTRIDIPEGVTSVGEVAICACNSVTLITIPASLIDINETAFNLSGNIRNFYVNEQNPVYKGYYGCGIVKKDTKTLIAGSTGLSGVSGEIEHIGNYAFCGRNLDPYSFWIHEGVVSIGQSAFVASRINRVSLPKTLKKCGSYAFQFPYADQYYSDISGVSIDDLAAWLDIDFDGAGANPLCNGASLYLNGELLESIVIPEGVTDVGWFAFAGWGGKEVVFPENVASIAHGAFMDCCSLTSITCKAATPPTIDDYTFYNVDKSIPLYVLATSFEAYKAAPYWSEFTNIQPMLAFGTCGDNLRWRLTSDGELIIEGTGDMYDFDSFNLNTPWLEYIEQIRNIKVSEGVTSIGDNAFRYCSNPTSITIPESVTSIGEYAFHSCSITAITIPEGVTNIGIGLFSGCNDLTEIIVAEGNTVYDSRNNCNAIIETSSNTLIAGRSTTVIPESVTSIGERAFSGNTNLTTITIPKSVTNIGYGAFRWCSLTSITCEAITPPTIESTTFQYIGKTIPLYVPAASVATYKSSPYWSEFTNIQPIASELPSVVYLKNVGSGKFLTAANWWGTCASLGEHGLDMTLALLPNGKYTIDTQIKGSESNYFLGKIGEKLYMDATSTEWMIEDQGNGRYTLSLDGTYYMGFDGTSVVSENLTNSADANAQWQLLTREDLITEMKYATMASPVDATFYIRGANFSRQDLRNSAWIGEPSIGGEDENFCAEKRNSGVCTVYQELKDLPNGVYKLKTQGFYRMGGHNVAVNHRNEGTENYDVKFLANDASVPVMSVMDEAGKLSDVGVAYGSYGNAPSDRAHATQFFNKGYYQHEFYFTVTDGTAVVGIVNNSGLLDDWMCFDNFELYYCGEAAVIMDSQASYTQAVDKQCTSISYIRNFKNTNWQALYVPFEIPLTAEFLNDYEVAYINDVHQFDDNNDGTIDRTEVEAIKKVSGTLEANYPYMIRAKVAGEKTITVTDATLYASEENSIDCSSVFSTYTFRGAYKKIPAVQLPKEEGYYALSGGSWKQYSSDATSSLGAFRIYMKVDSRNANMAVQTNTIRMRVIGADDEYADDTTGIDNAQLMMDDSQQIIYDLQGRRITNTANLKGLYIMNGKKVLF